MSPLHLAVTIGVGLLIGLIGYSLRFDRFRGDLFLFLFLSIVGSFGLNLFFRLLVLNKVVSYHLYVREAIVLEEIVGALSAVYLVTVWRSRRRNP